MCGILGAVGTPEQVRPECLLRGLAALVHRGPDDSGWRVIQQGGSHPITTFLGSRRLAILDLSLAGHQPMHDPETDNWIVYNGEIYNFEEIRLELESCSLSFNSRSDTEVILKAYAKWGTGCLKRFRGMFAFGIWDSNASELFLARDRFGEKPLYYVHHPKQFLFSSEVRALLQTDLIERRLDNVGLIQYLSYGSVSDPDSLIRGVQALPPAHYLLLRDGEVIIEKYWDLNSTERELEGPEPLRELDRETLAELGSRLEEAILLRTVSDVPLGVFLSGGIDSSSLVALLGSKQNKLSTFSVVFNELDYSEAKYSRSISALFGTDHHEIVISSQAVMVAVPEIIRAMDQPTVDGVNTYIISRETRRLGYKVALSGLGADELFAGYDSFRTVPRMEWFVWCASTLAPSLRRLMASVVRTVPFARSQRREKLGLLVNKNGSISHPYTIARMLFTPEQLRQLECSDDSMDTERANAPLNAMLKWAERFDPVNRTSYLELRHYMAATLLRDSDFMSMAHGLELRAPFIDHSLAEFLFRIPGVSKIDKHLPKWLLIQAVKDKLPREVVQRPKRGFTFPFELWLKGELRREIESVLLDSSADLLPGVNRKFAAKVWNDFLKGKTTWSRPWALYVLKQWTNTFLDSRSSSPVLDASKRQLSATG